MVGSKDDVSASIAGTVYHFLLAIFHAFLAFGALLIMKRSFEDLTRNSDKKPNK